MLCARCEKKPIYNKSLSLCGSCNGYRLAQENIDRLRVSPCAGDCGKRVHNMKYITVPGVAQGHGPGRARCAECSRKQRPEPIPKLRGNCNNCAKPMATNTSVSGFVRHRGKGLCAHCYPRQFTKSDNNKGENNGNSRLVEAHIVDIRLRIANGQAKREVARMYGVNPATVRHIVNMDTWSHI